MQHNTTTNSIYDDIIIRIKDVLSVDEISKWILRGESDIDMCFVGDECPLEYRSEVLEIIREVESEHFN